jgi:hypothetical protein
MRLRPLDLHNYQPRPLRRGMVNGYDTTDKNEPDQTDKNGSVAA